MGVLAPAKNGDEQFWNKKFHVANVKVHVLNGFSSGSQYVP
jgi:hypothetical protein